MASTISRVKSRGWLVVKRTRRIPGTWPTAASSSAKAQLPFRVAIAVHVLAQQLNLGIPRIGDPPRLGQHRRRSPAALLAARIRHHAIGAELVAALDDGDVPAIGILARRELGLERLVGLAVVEPRDAVLARLQPRSASPAACDTRPTPTPAKHTAPARRSSRPPAAPRTPARRTACRPCAASCNRSGG